MNFRHSDYFQGINIMTSEYVGSGWIVEGTAYEISSGHGMEGQPIFGVTVSTKLGQTDSRSKLVGSRAEAFDYVASLRAQIQQGGKA
jgi:hypothetical protein